VGHKEVLTAAITEFRRDPRYQRLLNDAITEDLGIAVDNRNDGGNLNAADVTDYRFVIVSGFRSNETVTANFWVGPGCIELQTTEAPAADRPASLAVRYLVTVPLWRRALRPFNLERDVIDRGTVVPGLSD